MRMFLIILMLSSIVGCTTAPSQEELAKADYGPAPSSPNYEKQIKETFEQSLFDPFSAQYKFGQPEKAWWRTNSGFCFGYRVPVKVNAKNRMGGYVGWRLYYFYFKGDILNTYEEDWNSALQRILE